MTKMGKIAHRPFISGCWISLAFLMASAHAADAPFAMDKHTLLLCHFDADGCKADYAASGNTGTLASNALPEVVPADRKKFGKCIMMGRKSILGYEINGGNFSNDVGTVELWINLNGPIAGEKEITYLFVNERYNTERFFLRFVKKAGSSVVLEYGILEGQLYNIVAEVSAWKIGEWHHVAASWGPGGMRLHIDEKLAGTNAYAGGLSRSDTSMLVGCYKAPGFGCDAKIDEFRVSDIQRYLASKSNK